ncbi:hypothetical protein ZHAS_00016237 [Anopheles sinensis]|uniref:Uncharacterized protein n=1 Tax=Anopheles sinensis TaxID=74873 RepID=A0A084WD77_ANOSI|nr:hypothetical protein ZHAS_00016237 [Anopheles sinensis]
MAAGGFCCARCLTGGLGGTAITKGGPKATDVVEMLMWRARACVARVAHEQPKAAWMDRHTNTAPERWDFVTEGGGEWPMEKQERSCFLSLGRTNPTSEPTVLVNVPESVPSHQGTTVRWGVRVDETRPCCWHSQAAGSQVPRSVRKPKGGV